MGKQKILKQIPARIPRFLPAIDPLMTRLISFI